MNGTFFWTLESSMSFADMCLQGENNVEMFTLFGAWICSLGRERWTKWTQGRSLSWVLWNNAG